MAAIPKLFAERLTERQLHRKILRRVHLKGDREFLQRVYERDESGGYVRIGPLSAEDEKRLKKLAREIKANRGVVRRGRLIIAGAVIVLIVVFNLVLKDRLATMAIEAGLERVFQARSDLTGLDFSPIRGHLRFRHLSVADRARPFRNLFELGPTEIAMDTLELLKGKVVLTNIECRDITWNTKRDVSGALPSAARSGGQESDAPRDGRRAAGPSFSGLPTVNVEALFRRHLDELSSPAALEQLGDELAGMRRTWEDRLRESERDLAALGARVQSVQNIDPGRIDSLEELRDASERITAVTNAVETVGGDVADVHAGLTDDLQAMEERSAAVRRTIREDYSYLESLVESPETAARNLVASMAAGYLREVLGGTYDYALRAARYAEELDGSGDSKDGGGDGRGDGIDVAFPARVHPKFLLERMLVSVDDSASGRTVEGSVRTVSSDQDLVGEPVRFQLAQTLDGTAIGLRGRIDTRERREDDLSLELTADGYPFAVSDGLDLLHLDRIAGSYRFRTDFSLGRGGDASGRASLELRELEISSTDADHPIASTVSRILTSASGISIDVRYSVSRTREVSIRASSSIDRIVAEQVGAAIREEADRYRSRLQGELDRHIAERLDENAELTSAVQELAALSGGNIAQARTYSEIVEDKRAEVEARIQALRRQGEERLKDEAEKTLDGARKKIKKPKLPF